MEVSDEVDADLNNITVMELKEANNLDAQAKMEHQVKYDALDWLVIVLVRVVTVIATELLLVISCCQGY